MLMVNTMVVVMVMVMVVLATIRLVMTLKLLDAIAAMAVINKSQAEVTTTGARNFRCDMPPDGHAAQESLWLTRAPQSSMILKESDALLANTNPDDGHPPEAAPTFLWSDLEPRRAQVTTHCAM